VWDLSKDADLQTRTIDVHIRSLRYKLGPEGRRIFTVRNVGYRLDTVLSE
jgi:two-component system alkaline phosphatase synthesis response regulator PhoP